MKGATAGAAALTAGSVLAIVGVSAVTWPGQA